jgi:hypothetical protein
VSCIIDKGSDFPSEFQALIESWQISAIFRSDMNRLTTRAWNGYGLDQHRGKAASNLNMSLLTLGRFQVPDTQDPPRGSFVERRTGTGDIFSYGLLSEPLHGPREDTSVTTCCVEASSTTACNHLGAHP